MRYNLIKELWKRNVKERSTLQALSTILKHTNGMIIEIPSPLGDMVKEKIDDKVFSFDPKTLQFKYDQEFGSLFGILSTWLYDEKFTKIIQTCLKRIEEIVNTYPMSYLGFVLNLALNKSGTDISMKFETSPTHGMRQLGFQLDIGSNQLLYDIVEYGYDIYGYYDEGGLPLPVILYDNEDVGEIYTLLRDIKDKVIQSLQPNQRISRPYALREELYQLWESIVRLYPDYNYDITKPFSFPSWLYREDITRSKYNAVIDRMVPFYLAGGYIADHLMEDSHGYQTFQLVDICANRACGKSMGMDDNASGLVSLMSYRESELFGKRIEEVLEDPFVKWLLSHNDLNPLSYGMMIKGDKGIPPMFFVITTNSGEHHVNHSRFEKAISTNVALYIATEEAVPTLEIKGYYGHPIEGEDRINDFAINAEDLFLSCTTEEAFYQKYTKTIKRHLVTNELPVSPFEAKEKEVREYIRKVKEILLPEEKGISLIRESYSLSMYYQIYQLLQDKDLMEKLGITLYPIRYLAMDENSISFPF